MSRILSFGRPMRPDPARLAALNDDIIARGWMTNGGPLAARLERRVGALLGAPAVLTSSGTMALMMGLHLGALPPGAEVIMPAISFPATAQAVAWCGLKPVFADVDPDRLTLCPKAARRAITARTRAILPVHLLGLPADPALDDLARDAGLWSVHDAAQAFGITTRGTPLFARADASAFSLHATKLLHTGEGGAVIAASRAPLQRMRNFGMESLRPTGPGCNAKLSEFSAAVGLSLLPDLAPETQTRLALRQKYDAAIFPCPGLRPHKPDADTSPSPVYYALRARPALITKILGALAQNHILARGPQPPLCGIGTRWPDQPAPDHAARLWGETLCLPLHSDVSEQDILRIADILHRCAKGQTS